MAGISNILDIGRWALFSSQTAIETTGNNVANVNTPGYHKRQVILEEAPSIDYNPGQLGQGVRAKEVVRCFNAFIEEQYNTKASDRSRWETLQENLMSVETIFENPEGSGINDVLSQFWSEWQNLAQRPEDGAARNSLLGKAANLLNMIHITQSDMRRLQDQMDDFISQDVQDVNEILDQIAEINRKITIHTVPGQNNPNELLDKRNNLMRDLSAKMDINIIDNGGGDLVITTRAGHTLVDGVESFELDFEGAQTFKTLDPNSNFDGNIYYSGNCEDEYLFEATSTDAVGTAELKISNDGGQSWLRDEDGNLLTVTSSDEMVNVPRSDLQIKFGDYSFDLQEGDRFTVIPKSALYWYETTSSKENITPMVLANGEDNPRRLVGGTLAGEFLFRDHFIGDYMEKLDAFTKGLAWEVNRLHSQGAGLKKLSDVTGTYAASNPEEAMAIGGSGLDFYDKLSQGSMTFYVYNKNSGNLISGSPFVFNFDPTDTTESTPTVDDGSLQAMVSDFNASSIGTYLTASEENGSLQLSAGSDYEFAIGSDSTGVLAGLGVNTFFQGDDAESIELNSQVKDVDYINAAQVNGAGEVNTGDNHTALQIADLQYADVQFSTRSDETTTQPLQEYYNSLTASVGSDTANAEYMHNFFNTLAEDLNSRQESISGVNLDEEMSNLIKFQQSYTAAARLITVTEKMMDVLLQM